MRQANIELHIEELVLHGFAPGDRYHISEAVERELAWLLAERGGTLSSAQGREITLLDGGGFEAARNSSAKNIGVQIAQAIFRGLSL
jgi:hypothetical protein